MTTDSLSSPPPTGMNDADVDLRTVLNVLWARRAIILSVMGVISLLALLVLLQLPSRYTAKSTLMLDTRTTQVTDFESVVSGLTVDEAVVRSEMAILSSRKLAYRVVESLKLQDDPEFNPQLREKLAEQENGGAKPLLERILGNLGLAPEKKGDGQPYPINRVVTNVLNNFDVDNDGKSYALTIAFTSEDPEKAARIVNAWAEQYLVDQLEVKFEATQRANAWLSERLAELKEKVTIADNAVAAAREKYNIVETPEGDNLSTRQLTELSSQLVIAQSDRSQAEARLRQTQELARSNNGIDSVAEVLNSPLIQKLREQEADILRREAELSSRYGDRHPDMINVRSELRDMRRKISEEVARIISSLQNDLAVARSREATLRQRISEAQNQVAFSNRAQIQIEQLEREAAANQTLYESFLNRFKQTGQENMQQADARVIARADVPENPSKPKRSLIMMAAVVASALLGVFIVFLMEMLHNTFRTSIELEKFSNLKTLAMVPRLDRSKSKALVGYLRSNLTSPYAESVRAVLTALQFTGDQGRPVQTIAVTSSIPSEGKSFFALSLANVAAMGGKKVLMVDCDLRRPAIAPLLKVKADRGVADYLRKQAKLEEVIYHDKATGMDYCFAVQRSSIPQSLLGTPEMEAFLQSARQKYDYIVIDTPPVMAVSDVIVLAPMVDHILYAVRYEKTPRRVVRTAMRTLQHSVKTPLSMIMTQVDVVRHARYGYGDEGYYYGKYGHYYAQPTQAA